MNEIELIDTHCHIYLEEFVPDLSEILGRADKANIKKIYMPGLDLSHQDAVVRMEQDHPGLCFAMSGLHPCYVKADVKEELAGIQNITSERKFAAIGEIGLDYYWDRTFMTEQKQAFAFQMGLALELGIPIVIHSREAMDDTIEMIRGQKGLTGIFHCFSGSVQNARDIIDCGLKLGIGGVVTYKKAGLAEVVAQIELEHLVLETDAPYLSPVPFRGKRNEPSYVRFVAEKVAEIKGTTLKEVARITTANAQNIFGSYGA